MNKYGTVQKMSLKKRHFFMLSTNLIVQIVEIVEIEKIIEKHFTDGIPFYIIVLKF